MEIYINITHDITDFATKKGWTKTIIEFQESAVEGRVQFEKENPISAEQFVSDYFKKNIATEIANCKCDSINEDFEAQKKAKLEEIHNEVLAEINVDLK